MLVGEGIKRRYLFAYIWQWGKNECLSFDLLIYYFSHDSSLADLLIYYAFHDSRVSGFAQQAKHNNFISTIKMHKLIITTETRLNCAGYLR